MHFPNPFNGQVTIPYSMPENALTADLVIHNLLGKEVGRLELVSGSIVLF